MFPGSPARLRACLHLASVLPLAQPGVVLGVWLRGCKRPSALRCQGPAGSRHLLVADDLGYLLCRCTEVVVRDGDQPSRISAAVLVGWRVLEIVLAAPYLPAPEQLRALFPTARVRSGVVALPIGLGSAEEALAVCAVERLPVSATRIAYLAGQR
ncbi:MAG: hypothetical protein H0X69_14865 [Gemmatimonadales bacterium]|nr:hypothetical protein [Gemmatimonadales bacterium]